MQGGGAGVVCLHVLMTVDYLTSEHIGLTARKAGDTDFFFQLPQQGGDFCCGEPLPLAAFGMEEGLWRRNPRVLKGLPVVHLSLHRRFASMRLGP